MDRPIAADEIAHHYAAADVRERLADALRRAGLDPDRLAASDLAPVDQFHSGGRPATLELAELAGLGPGMKVIDLGGGLGGPARTLAATRGCDVTVVDITPEFCRAGEWLTRSTGLADRVRFHAGDALATPFADGSFDAVWTQHSTMNIADKAGLYREVRRLLRPGGVFAMHEVAAGPVQPVLFPVPWAETAALSSLIAPERMRQLLAEAGLREVVWRDVTADGMAFYQERLRAMAAEGPPPLGLHIVIGPHFAAGFRNLIPNVTEKRMAVVQAVLRPA
jgi:SAM-dependent methyltransferase